MIVVTATLLFLLLAFSPIYLKADITLYLRRMSADIKVGVGAIKVFNENVRLAGGSLHCEGTVSTDVELRAIDKKSSIDLIKCITVEKVAVWFYNNFASVSQYTAIQNAVLALATVTACNLFHCQIYTESVGTLNESCVRICLLINVSVAELSFCLLKQGVRKWKTRKSKK